MNKYIVFVTFIGCSFISFSQKYIKPFVGVNFSNRILTTDVAERKDSLNNTDKMKPFPSAGVQFLFEKTQGREFYFGINYLENGFVRERLDYKFLDSVNGIGRIYDLSQAAQKNGYFTYHFKYLELPIGFNFQVSPRSSMNFYTAWFNVGVTPQLLVKQNLTVFLQGFSMGGQNRFDFPNTGYDASKFNIAFQSGGRFDINVKGKFWVTADALIRMQLLHTATNSFEKLRVWHLTANLGLRYEIGDF